MKPRPASDACGNEKGGESGHHWRNYESHAMAIQPVEQPWKGVGKIMNKGQKRERDRACAKHADCMEFTSELECNCEDNQGRELRHNGIAGLEDKHGPWPRKRVPAKAGSDGVERSPEEQIHGSGGHGVQDCGPMLEVRAMRSCFQSQTRERPAECCSSRSPVRAALSRRSQNANFMCDFLRGVEFRSRV